MPGAPEPSAPDLAAEALTRRFGDRVAVDDVSFVVPHGEIFDLPAPNGPGKSTVGEMMVHCSV